MRSLRQYCVALFLASLLATQAFAGDMGFPGVNVPQEVEPPPPPAEQVAGDTQFPGAMADPVTEIALAFLLDVSSLL